MGSFIRSFSQLPWSTPWIEMYQRIFNPSSVPLRAEAYIETNADGTGWSSTSQKYEFPIYIKNMDQKPISMADKDFYVPLVVVKKDPSDSKVIKIVEYILRNLKRIFFFWYPHNSNANTTHTYLALPSTLFWKKIENNTVSFYINDQPIQLTLSQKNHSGESFEKVFSSLEKKPELKEPPTFSILPALVQQCAQAQQASTLPIKAQAYILTNNGMTGRIGKDRKYEFHKHIKDKEKKKIEIKKNDFYVPIMVIPQSDRRIPKTVDHSHFYLPSTLFEGKKENETVSFYLDDQLIELTLTQMNHPLEIARENFEKYLYILSRCLIHKHERPTDPGYRYYLFSEDTLPETIDCIEAEEVPQDIKAMVKDKLILRNFTPDAAISIPKEREWTLLSQIGSEKLENTLREFTSHFDPKNFHMFPYRTLTIRGFPDRKAIELEAPAITKENFSLLIDGNLIFITGDKNIRKTPEDTIIKNTSPNHLSVAIRVERAIDPSLTTLTMFDNIGMARLDLFYKQ